VFFVPATAVVLPSVIVIFRSALKVIASESVALLFGVFGSLIPAATIVPYLCLVDKSKSTTIESIFSKFELDESDLKPNSRKSNSKGLRSLRP